MRIAIAAAVTCLSIAGVTATAQVHAAIRQHTEIPAESLDLALRTLAKDRGFQLVYLTENVAALRTRGATGELTVEEALKKLLGDSRLEYKFVDDNTVSIFPRSNQTSALESDQAPASVAREDASGSTSKRSPDHPFRLAQVAPGSSSGAASVAASSSSEERVTGTGISEIVVTAQKREERLQDVPIPMSVVDTQQLTETNQLRVQDYYSSVPGLAFISGVSSAANQTIAIRGITSGADTNPTVGITVDDVPYGSVTNLGGGNTFPNIDPGELARIEVLRGPQGTLYGASSLGGLIKFVTIDPSTEGFSGRVQAGVSSVYSGAEAGYNFRGSVNVPLGDTFAIRASAFTRQDPGYISNPISGVNGVNELRESGGRLAMLWRPLEDFSLKLSALYQKYTGDGTNDSTIGLGPLQQSEIRGTGVNEGSTQAYNATLHAKVWGIDITSLSGFNVHEADADTDFSAALAPLPQKVYGYSGAGLEYNNKTEKFTQELRFSSSIGEHMDWLLGGFYTHEYSPYVQMVPIINPATGQVVNTGFSYSAPTTYAEYAAFADLTFHITDRFDVQFGGRESDIKQVSEPSVTLEPLFGVTAPIDGKRTEASAKPFTYLVTPRFKLTQDLMLYARFASGYRAGGPNSVLCNVDHFQCQFDPDKTETYEAGAKADFLQHTLSIDASLYYIDWKNIQLGVVQAGTSASYDTNAGGAKSQGVEFSVDAKPFSGMTVGVWFAYDDAVLTKALPASAGYGLSGDRLPFSSRFSGRVSLDQDFPITNLVTGFAGASVNYVGDRAASFGSAPTPPRELFPGYTKIDLRGGVRYGSWTVDLYLNNATDQRGILNTDPTLNTVIYIPPRTAGLNVATTF